MSGRTKIIAGNWKMNKTPSETASFISELKEALGETENEIVVAVPFVCIPAALAAAAGSRIQIAAQNMHFAEKGAYTGEVSGAMLQDLGLQYVIIGHSERREYFAETDETVNQKVHAAFRYGLKPIVCVGESLTQRDQGVMPEHIRYQVKVALLGLAAEQVASLVIAYEPIWAIGTGRNASKEQTQEVCAIIRQTVCELYGKETAERVRIQYGGSVNAANSAELFGMPDIDGGLVGGASLKVQDFTVIASYKG